MVSSFVTDFLKDFLCSLISSTMALLLGAVVDDDIMLGGNILKY
jgi:hypothetical protein